MEHLRLKLYKVYVNDDPGLTYDNISLSGERLQDHWSSGFNISQASKIYIQQKKFGYSLSIAFQIFPVQLKWILWNEQAKVTNYHQIHT